MTPTPLTPDEVVFRFRDKGISVAPKARAEIDYWLARLPDAGLVVVEATAPISDVVRDGADKSSRETADSCRSMENGTPLTCELPAGHDGPHSFDPSPDGLVPDPREPGTWLGRVTDVPDGWEFRRWTSTDFRQRTLDTPSDIFVQARPPQTTTSPPRWTIEEDADGWNLVMADEDEDRIMALIGHLELARRIADALNAGDVAGAAAPQPQDNWVFAQEAEGDRG